MNPRVLINITSYNRLPMLANLVTQLDGYKIAIFDDNSDFSQLDNMYRFEYTHGKKEAWKKFNTIFEINRKLWLDSFDYFIFLPDDVVLCDYFINKAINLWDGIEDNKKICLSFSSVERTKNPCFTEVKAIDCGNVIKTQWVDMMFICGKEFINKVKLEPVDPKRWDRIKTLSSGVGSQISHKLHNEGYNLYNTKEDLVEHIGNECSLMNPQERKINKL